MGIDVRQSTLNNRSVGNRPTDSADVGRDGEVAGRKDAPTAGSDRVELSAATRKLKALAETARQGPDIDSARVERIRAQIAEGKYHVDTGRLADRIADLEAELQRS